MTSSQAWKLHGCYTLNSKQYFNIALGKSFLGCCDDWNALDPTTDTRHIFARFFQLRTIYGALQDGFNLFQHGNWSYFIDRAGSNGARTEIGLWSVSRSRHLLGLAQLCAIYLRPTKNINLRHRRHHILTTGLLPGLVVYPAS